MSFKVSPKAKAIINGGFIFQFHDGIRSKILPTVLEMFFRHFIKMNMTEQMNSHLLNAVWYSRINKLRYTAIELGSKYTFFKTWNSFRNNIDSLNYSLSNWLFLSLKNLRVTLKNANHPVITYGKILRLISLPNNNTEYLILNICF